MEMRWFHSRTRLYELNTVIVGTGAAGLNAADRLWSMGQRDIAMVTDHVKAGTSRNTGSDKQTYYKLTLAGDKPDSVGEMARTLFEGQCVDGDLALCEAALSAQCFLRLADLGVPFPQNRWGEYVGYKTDHDPRCRATSIGPYTSKSMTERLEASVRAKEIRIFDNMQVVSILSDGKRAYGLLCLDLEGAAEETERFALFCCKNIVYATGGPAGMYADSVYPESQFGASGLAFEAGVVGKNLTEWQFGLASVKPRWNVSGTYMQVLPKFVSMGPSGEEREFLLDFFEDFPDMLTNVFLKGYQWPFDVRKAAGGSSIIDLLVYLERRKGRRIYLDYRENPGGKEIPFEDLGGEALAYLKRAGACFGTPIQRLEHMNAPAVEFYRSRGVDLKKERLEIALCAQHNNGGLSTDAWWQTNLEGFFAAGEVSGTHGVYRPGGTALNAGQVGGTRAAQYIARRRSGRPETGPDFERAAKQALKQASELADQALSCGEGAEENRVAGLWKEASERMSLAGGAVRNTERIGQALEDVKRDLRELETGAGIAGPGQLWRVFRLKDMLVSQFVYLSAMWNYAKAGGRSRGSALYTDAGGQKPGKDLPEELRFSLEDGSRGGMVQEAVYRNEEVFFQWRPVRPIPQEDDFFENIWRTYRENGNVY